MQGKNILIIGASSGIGHALALNLQAQGVTLFTAGRPLLRWGPAEDRASPDSVHDVDEAGPQVIAVEPHVGRSINMVGPITGDS